MRILFLLYFLFFSLLLRAQPVVGGRVFDNSKKNYVENARVVSTGGKIAFTDSLGLYRIAANATDSIFFVYNDKPTQKFAVSSMKDPNNFDISLHIPVKSKYNSLQEVVVYSKSFKQDSIENRETYADIFGYKKPGIVTGISPTGGVGMDVNELINMFRFRRNRNLRAFQLRLERDEKEKYIDYRFNKNFVKRLTNLSGAALDSFVVWYRPTYEFASSSSVIDFNQYVLNALYHFQRVNPGEMKKPGT